MSHHSFRHALCATASIVFLSACGSNGQLPPGATVEVSPQTKDVDISSSLDENGNCVLDDRIYTDIPIQAVVKDSNGAGIGQTDLRVLADWSGNTFSGFEAVKVYADLNGNGRIDEESEYVSHPDAAAFGITTDKFSGEAFFLVRANLSCPYRGQVTIMGEGVTGTMTIDINDGSQRQGG